MPDICRTVKYAGRHPAFFRKIFMHFTVQSGRFTPFFPQNSPSGYPATVRRTVAGKQSGRGHYLQLSLPDGCRTVDIRTVAGHHPEKFDTKYQKITVRRIKSLNFCKKFTIRRTKIRFFDPKNATFYRPPDDFRLFYEILQFLPTFRLKLRKKKSPPAALLKKSPPGTLLLQKKSPPAALLLKKSPPAALLLKKSPPAALLLRTIFHTSLLSSVYWQVFITEQLSLQITISVQIYNNKFLIYLTNFSYELIY